MPASTTRLSARVLQIPSSYRLRRAADSDDIVIFSIDQNTGRLTLAGHTPTLGQVPRNFNIDPSGRFLICVHQDSNNVVTFMIDQVTGALTPTGQSLEVINAICTQFAPTLA